MDSRQILISKDALLEAGQQDHLSNLSSDALRNIFKFLGISDLYNLQLVCKRLRTEVNKPPFLQTVCKRLGVKPSEYASAEEAKNICRRILDLTRPFDKPLFRVERTVEINSSSLSIRPKFDYKDGLLVITAGRTIYNDAGDARVTLEDVISCVKIFVMQREYDVFCGTVTGVTQRWRNIFNGETPVMVTEYSRHERPVSAMDVIEAENLLLTGGGNIFVWRLSTGEPLKTITRGFVINLKIWRPTFVADGSYFIAAICFNRLHIFRMVYEGTDLRISPCNLLDDILNVKWGLCVRDDGIRVGHRSSESEVFLCHFDGATLRKQQILLHQGEDIWQLYAIGTKYCLMESVDVDGDWGCALSLFEKSGNAWKPLNSRSLTVDDDWKGVARVVLCDESWLDGFRLNNTRGPVFLFCHAILRNVSTFFWN